MVGYVTFVDVETNISDKVVIRAYDTIDTSDNYTEYIFHKITLKMLSRHTSKEAYLPYTVALDILDRALELDKKSRYYVDMAFVYIPNEKLDVKVDKIIKDMFPLPDKSLTYLPRSVFANVTENLSGSKILSNLEASLYAYNYNNALIRYGYRGDRVFHYSCGRVLMQTDWLMQSYKGRKQFKAFFPDVYDAARSVSGKLVQSYGIKLCPGRSANIDNDNYSNNFLKAHSLVSHRMGEVDFGYIIKHPDYVTELIRKQLEIYNYEFQKDYYANLVQSLKSYEYLSYKDILRLHIDADFRVNLDKYISDIRKIYNANISRDEFKCILSDGRFVR